MLLLLGHCLAPELDANCTQCPCPQGYACIEAQNVCVIEAQKDDYQAVCAEYVTTEQAPETKSEVPPDAGEVSPDKAPEARPEPRPEPRPEIPADAPPPGLLNLHDTCDLSPYAKADGRCKAGHRCVRMSISKAVCLQDCSSNPDVCKAPRDQCRQINWQLINGLDRPVSVCVQEKDTEGDNCDPSRSVYCRRASQAGAKHLACRKGKCVAGTLETVQNVSCDPTSETSPQECDLTQKLTCDVNRKCVKGLPAAEGEICDPVNRRCGPGMYCTAIEDSPPICRRTCSQSSDCGNPQAFYCYKSNIPVGVCLQIGCNHFSQCTVRAPPHNCHISNFPPNITTGECRPFSVKGAAELGEACGVGSSSGLYCQYPFNCVGLAGGSGFCTLPCFTNTDCTVGNFQGQCLTSSSHGVHVCIWRCESQPFCPGTLSCLTVQSGSNTLKLCGRR